MRNYNKDNKSMDKSKASKDPNVNHSTNKPKSSRKRNSKCETKRSINDSGDTLGNDVSWYNKYPDLLASTSRISTGYPIGIDYDIMGQSNLDYNLVNSVHTMRLCYTHGVGRTENDRDPINLAATKLYSYVRHANSGHSNYERSDLMLYFMAAIECYNLVAIAARVYGTIQMFNQYNRALPKHVIKAIGWDYDDVSEKASILRTRVNNAIARLNSLYIPTELNIMKRWWWLNTNIFVDSNGPKAMNYVFTPNVYRTWEEMSGGTGGYLKAYDIPETLTVSTWTAAINKCLDKLLDSEDIGIMSGDILKAFGDRVYTLSMISEDYSTKFIYSEEVLTQINNTTVLGYTLTNNDITQDVNGNLNSGLRFIPKITLPDNDLIYYSRLAVDPVMNFPVANPDNELVMVASRNTVSVYDYNDETHELELNCGSEVVTNEKMYSVNGVLEFKPSNMDARTSAKHVMWHNQFDYAPLMKFFDDTALTLTASSSHYENVVPVDERTLGRMHDTALLSLFSALV